MKYGSAHLLLGWERWLQRLETDTETAMRELRQAKHLISPDNKRFAPVRLQYELGRGDDPAKGNNNDVHAEIAAEATKQGWRLVAHSDAGFDNLFERYADYCLTFGASNAPRCYDHPNDPKLGRTFLVPGF